MEEAVDACHARDALRLADELVRLAGVVDLAAEHDHAGLDVDVDLALRDALIGEQLRLHLVGERSVARHRIAATGMGDLLADAGHLPAGAPRAACHALAEVARRGAGLVQVARPA
jgi:hypothetical protein